jgi:hypothetical protein
MVMSRTSNSGVTMSTEGILGIRPKVRFTEFRLGLLFREAE